MRKTSEIGTLLVALLGLSLGCVSGSEAKDRVSVEAQQSHYQKAQPIPKFDYSLERDVAIQLYKARNERVTTWTVWRSDTGIVEGDCPSIGYPIPYDTSLTNPLQRVYSHDAVIEQAEPNGLFSSKNSISTWVRCITKVNDKEVEAPVYIESKVTAYPYPVAVDYVMNRVTPVEGREPSVTIEKSK
jgi:hypothetical protein